MTGNDFIATIKQLENYYQKEMTDEQKKIWFENLKKMDIRRFNYLIGQLYKTQKFMPKLADVLELNNAIGQVQQDIKENKVDCKECNNTGYVLYWKKANNTSYQFMAVCKCGRRKPYRGWEVQDDRNKNDYFIPSITEIFEGGI